MRTERFLQKSKFTKTFAAIILTVAVVFPLPVCYSAESIPFTETPLYKYLLEAAQQKSPTYQIQLQQLERHQPKEQPQEQPEQKTDAVVVDKPYKPAPEITREPIRQISHSPLSSLTPETTFGEALDILCNSVKPPLNIFVLWKDLEDNADIDRGTPIGIEPLSGITVRNHLELILASVSTMGDKPLGYVIEGGIIRIATKDSLPKLMGTRVYDITDLTAAPARFYQYGGPYTSFGGPYGQDRGYGPGGNYQYGGSYGGYPSRYGQGSGYGGRFSTNTYRGYPYGLGRTYGSGISFY